MSVGSLTMMTSFHRRLARIENALAFLAGMAIVAATALGTAEVVGRSIFNRSVLGYIDLVEYLAAIFAFMGLAYCQRSGGHVGMNLLTDKLPRGGKNAAALIDTLIGLVFVGILSFATWKHFERAYQFGDSSMDIQIPMWPAKLLIPIALAIWWLRLLVQFSGYVALLISRQAESELVPADPHADFPVELQLPTSKDEPR